VAQAGTLSYNAGTRVLTYTGGDAANIVFADHPSGDTTRLRLVDVGAGQEMTAAGVPGCEPDDIDFYLVCPAPAKLVVLLGGGDDSFSDENTGGGEPTAIPVEVNGGNGTDEFDGGDGADVLRGGLGADTIQGDNGTDTIEGEDGDDTLDGAAGNDGVVGGQGNDRLTGGHGNDTVRGGDGNDELDYNPEYALDGSDVYEGGGGSDTVGYFGRTVSVGVSLDGQANDGQAGESDNIGADIEVVDGSDAGDVLIGSAGPNGLAGRGGDDQISGLGGNDLIYGDTGNDTITGDDGEDTLDGGCHDDRITGGPGVDSLNSDGTCASPELRGMNDVLHARDGLRDSLVLCTISGTPGDTAIVDSIDPALPAGNPGGCRTIEIGTTTPGGSTTTPGGSATNVQRPSSPVAPPASSGTTSPGTSVALSAALVRGQRLLRALRRGLKVSVNCNRPCRLNGTLLANSRLMARVVTVARGGKTLTRAGATTLVLKFSPKTKRKLRSRRGVQGTLRVRATPLGGGSATVKDRRVRLRR
jgi:Ca2+-binding RTX toxin-like protein